MPNELTVDQTNALNSLSPKAVAAGANLGDLIEELLQATRNGPFAIEATAADVDAIAVPDSNFAYNGDTTTGLTLGYHGGRIRSGGAVITVAASTIALSSSTTNYVEVNSAGVVSKNTSGFTAGS